MKLSFFGAFLILFVRSKEIQCQASPFCGLLDECCSKHRECYSMCCSKDEQCVEPKFCYSTAKGQVDLIEDVSDHVLKPAINSTSVPYFYPVDDSDPDTPCFTYAYLDDIGNVTRN